MEFHQQLIAGEIRSREVLCWYLSAQAPPFPRLKSFKQMTPHTAHSTPSPTTRELKISH